MPDAAIPRSRRPLVVLIGFYLMLQPLASDFYLASLPGLTRTFAASAATVQLTLSVFMLAFGVMQLVAGPVSDRYGRVPVLLGGLIVYAAACVACALAPSIELLIAARFVQAIGCCAAVVVARAIIRDVFDAQAGAAALAQASTILAFGPLIGPILGSVLEVRFGHRAIFAVMAGITVALLAVTIRKLSETNRHLDPNATHVRRLAANYATVFRSSAFRAYTLAGAASYGGLFAFISGSSFVLIQVLGVPTAWFGLCFAFCVVGYLVGTLACRRLLAHLSIARAMKVGAAIALGAGVAMTALALAGIHHWAALLLPQFFYFAAHGINFPCSQVGSLAPFQRRAGAAAGLFGFLLMIAASLIGTLIGATYNGTVLPMVLTVAGCAAVVFLTVNFPIARLASSASG
jgi:DHA1 family bicyclomycin/chloramphenicol resistance-like MFS transporter